MINRKQYKYLLYIKNKYRWAKDSEPSKIEFELLLTISLSDYSWVQELIKGLKLPPSMGITILHNHQNWPEFEKPLPLRQGRHKSMTSYDIL